MRLWAPLNGDIDLVRKFKNTEVVGWYGSCPEISPSARENRVLGTQNRAKFYELVHEVHRNGMLFNYVYNSILDVNEIHMMDILGDISALRADVVTFASPLPLILAQDMKPKPQFEISTVAEIVNRSQCTDWKGLGADRFCLSTKLSRFPEIIRREFAGLNIKILVNEICNLNCIFRPTHYINQANNRQFKKYPYERCQEILRQKWPEQILKNSWVLPSQLKNYQCGIDFKVVGRTQPSFRIEQWLNMYLDARDPQDIMNILPYGKAADDETKHAGFKTVKGESLHLFKNKIAPEFFEHFAETTEPCYARDCRDCTLCKRIGAGYNF